MPDRSFVGATDNTIEDTFGKLTSNGKIAWIEQQFWKGLLDGTKGIHDAAFIIFSMISQDAFDRANKTSK